MEDERRNGAQLDLLRTGNKIMIERVPKSFLLRWVRARKSRFVRDDVQASEALIRGENKKVHEPAFSEKITDKQAVLSIAPVKEFAVDIEGPHA